MPVKIGTGGLGLAPTSSEFYKGFHTAWDEECRTFQEKLDVCLHGLIHAFDFLYFTGLSE